MALAHLVVHQQRRLVGEPGRHARVAGRHADGLVKLDVVPAVVLQNGWVGAVQPDRRLESLAFPPRVARFFDAIVGHGHTRALDRHVAQGDQHRAASAHVLAQLVLESQRQRAHIGKRHERVFGG